jgi:hypothetical protein
MRRALCPTKTRTPLGRGETLSRGCFTPFLWQALIALMLHRWCGMILQEIVHDGGGLQKYMFNEEAEVKS